MNFNPVTLYLKSWIFYSSFFTISFYFFIRTNTHNVVLCYIYHMALELWKSINYSTNYEQTFIATFIWILYSFHIKIKNLLFVILFPYGSMRLKMYFLLFYFLMDLSRIKMYFLSFYYLVDLSRLKRTFCYCITLNELNWNELYYVLDGDVYIGLMIIPFSLVEIISNK